MIHSTFLLLDCTVFYFSQSAKDHIAFLHNVFPLHLYLMYKHPKDDSPQVHHNLLLLCGC